MNDEWRVSAECRKHDPEQMASDWHTIVAAKRICDACPVSAECLAWAIEGDEPWGVWGGLDRHERRRYVRTREIFRCSIHGIPYATTCVSCRRDAAGETAPPPVTASKVGGRQDQIREWAAAGFRDTEIARMIGEEIGATVSPTTVTKFRQRWGIERIIRHSMPDVRAVYSSHNGFASLTRPEKESLWKLWEESGRTYSEFAKTFRTNWETARSLAKAAQCSTIPQNS